MAGYDYQNWMSNNAVAAYQENIKPLSKITTTDLKESNIGATLSFAKWLARTGRWDHSEWHHSSKFYNEVYFYDVAELRGLLNEMTGDCLEGLKEQYRASVREKGEKREKKEKNGERVMVPVSGSYAVWSDTRIKHIKRWEKFTGMLDDNGWIHLEDGARKKASSNNIKYRTLSDVNSNVNSNVNSMKQAQDGAKEMAEANEKAAARADAKARKRARRLEREQKPDEGPEINALHDTPADGNNGN